MNSVKKILILGGPGSGKSILSSNLGQKLNIPVYHLDEIHIKSDIEKNGKKDRNNNILKILEMDCWIIDGNYRGTLKERIDNCDIIFFLDYPTHKLISSVLYREIKNHKKTKKKKLNFNVIKLPYQWSKNKRKDVINMLKETDKKLYIFKKRKKLNNWYKNEFNENIRRI